MAFRGNVCELQLESAASIYREIGTGILKANHREAARLTKIGPPTEPCGARVKALIYCRSNAFD